MEGMKRETSEATKEKMRASAKRIWAERKAKEKAEAVTAPEGFDAFEAGKTYLEKYETPYLAIAGHTMSVNKATLQELGGEPKFVKLYFDKANCRIGLWFWQSHILGSYKLFKSGTGRVGTFTGKSFIKMHNIQKKVEDAGTRYFPLVRDEKNKDFFTASLINKGGVT